MAIAGLSRAAVLVALLCLMFVPLIGCGDSNPTDGNTASADVIEVLTARHGEPYVHDLEGVEILGWTEYYPESGGNLAIFVDPYDLRIWYVADTTGRFPVSWDWIDYHLQRPEWWHDYEPVNMPDLGRLSSADQAWLEAHPGALD